MIAAAAVTEYLRTADLRWITQMGVARRFGVGDRTLRRRLAESGKSFRDLLDAERLARMDRLLAAGHLPAKSIHGELGFVELNSFYRWYYSMHGERYGQRCPDRKPSNLKILSNSPGGGGASNALNRAPVLHCPRA